MRKASKMQLKAIMHGEGPARVLAGPGSGKTFTIIQRIHYLIQHYHILPHQILCVTFTKAAALEMEQRFYHDFPEIEQQYESKVHFGTLHSLCFQILKESGQFFGFSLVSESTKRNIIKHQLATEPTLSEADYDMIMEVLASIGKKKNTSLEEIPLFLSKEQFQAIYDGYESMLKERKLLDFDDMICESLLMLLQNRRLLEKWQSIFSYILVDEFQDLNKKQYEIIKQLAAPQNNLFIVGDDDQSIYGFRGALPGIMKQFEADYPTMKHLFLTENYRSGNKIVKLAAKMIADNTERLPKEPVPIRNGGTVGVYFQKSTREEEALLVSHLKQLSTDALYDSAVILRTNREVGRYRMLLKKAGLPIKEKIADTTNIWNHFIAEDISAFLRFLYEGQRREDFLMFMNKPERYLSRQALYGEIVTADLLTNYYASDEKMKRLVTELFFHIQRASELSPHLAIRYFRQVLGYDAYLEETAASLPEKEKRKEIITALQESFRKMKRTEKVNDFLRKAEAQMLEGKKEENTDVQTTKGISVLTMHSAKGLEFSYVFLPDLNEGIIPGRSSKTKESIEEERRLLYVAITRAKEFLYLYYTGERNRKPTRFLKKVLTQK